MYHILLLPIISGIIAQFIKLFTGEEGKKFDIKNILIYSGMPSGHSAMVVSLATIIGLEEGLSSPAFAVSAILALIVIRDALGLRRYLGEHGKILNVLVGDLREDLLLDEQYPRLLERIGHTPSQVMVGSLIGLLISVAGYLLLS